MSKLYLPRLRKLADEFTPRGVRFVLVDSNSQDDEQDIRRAVGESMPPVIRDTDGAWARRWDARSTTETIVLDRAGRLVYRGAVDDQYGFDWRKSEPGRHFLREAIEAALAGRAADPAQTDPLGCALEWRGPEAAASDVTFHEQIEPLLQRHCQRCHHRGGNAPFALEDYREVRGWRRMIRRVVAERRMPPWGADPAHGRFANDASLSKDEIELIARWVEGGAPEGDPAAAPPRREFPDTWRIGTPDATFTTPAFDVPAEGTLPYRYVRIPTRYAEDRWIEAFQIRSTARETIHHVLVFLEDVRPGMDRPWTPPFNPQRLLEGARPREVPQWIARFRKLIVEDLPRGGGGGLNGYLANSSSGQEPVIHPEGRARLLPAGATLVFQIHTTPTGKATTSETTLAVRWAKQPPREPIYTGSIATVAFKIPPGAEAHPVTATLRLPRDGLLLSLRPHMHLRGRSFRYTAQRPDGTRQILLEVPRWDFNWQLDYVLAEPIRLPKGTILRVEATYDNSERNPYNPDPTREVYFGIQSEEEMLIGYYDMVWLEPP
jgi:hypothetical protein